MSKQRIDPLQRINEQGYLGYVEEGTPLEVPIDDIIDSPFQTREELDPEDEEAQAKYARLVHSIKTRGVKPPLQVQRHPTLEGKFFPAAGGHRRRDAARDAGLPTVPVEIVEYSRKEMGIATALENLARNDLTPVEEGRLYRLLMETLHWTQEELATELGMKNRGRIKDCVALIDYAPDILVMVRKRKGNSGVRAAGYLHRLDDPKYEISPDVAAQLRAPIIGQFQGNILSTDGVRIAVEAAIANYLTERSAAAQPSVSSPRPVAQSTVADRETPHGNLAHPAPERTGQVHIVSQRFDRYERMIGQDPPSQSERETLIRLLEKIQAILKRS